MGKGLQSTDGFHLAGWMRTELGLTGAELFTYALVHQFSQSSAGIYRGGLTYLASWLGCTTRSALKYLKSLVAKGLIIEDKGAVNNVPYCNYYVNLEVLQNLRGVVKNFQEGSENISHRTIKGTINNNIYTNNSVPLKFVKPTLSEVSEYCQSRNNGIDASAFLDYYESNGWMVGRTHMKDWKAAVRNWERTQRKPSSRSGQPQRKESVFEHNLRVADQMFGTNYHEQYYGKKENPDEQ